MLTALTWLLVPNISILDDPDDNEKEEESASQARPSQKLRPLTYHFSAPRKDKRAIILREVELRQGQVAGIPQQLAVFLVTPLMPALGLAVLWRPFQLRIQHRVVLYMELGMSAGEEAGVHTLPQ